MFAISSNTMLGLRGAVKDYLQARDRYVGVGRFRHLIAGGGESARLGIWDSRRHELNLFDGQLGI